jgi:hypothetical protein
MTVRSAATLKGYFNTGDTPSETNFADFIDTIAAPQGNFTLLPTTGASVGVIMAGSDTLIHTYGDPDTNGRNLFVGKNAGNFTMSPGGGAVTLASQNIALGENALLSLTTGYDNSAFGYDSLMYTTTGKGNTGVGVGTMHYQTIGDNNTAIGLDALNLTTQAGRNTAIGANALRQVTEGGGNTAVGAWALEGATGWAGGNTAIGLNALLVTTGNYSIAIGYCAGARETGSSKLYIDNQLNATEAADRTHAIIYGVMDATVANQTLAFNTGSMGFFGHVAAAQPTKAGHNNWAAVSDVVAALVAIGIFDAA